MPVTIAEICDNLASTLGTATGMTTVESYNELSEGLSAADLPLIQVYWQDLILDPSGGTDRTTFGAGVRHNQMTFHVDLYAAPRSHLAENMEDLVDMVDTMMDVFEAQDVDPYFGEAGIRSWQLVSASRAIFEYTAGLTTPVHYIGARFILTIHTY